MFKKGDRVEIAEPISAIPAGCYTFVEMCGEMLFFCCGDKIQIGISKDCLSKMKKVSREASLTKPKDYLPKYFELLRELKFRPFSSKEPFTFCGIDPSSPFIRKLYETYPFETRQ